MVHTFYYMKKLKKFFGFSVSFFNLAFRNYFKPLIIMITENNKNFRQSILDEFNDILNSEIRNAEDEGRNERADILRENLNRNERQEPEIRGFVYFN